MLTLEHKSWLYENNVYNDTDTMTQSEFNTL